MKNDEQHSLLVTVLTSIIPWVALAAAGAFATAWLVSALSGSPDLAAAIVTIGLGVFAAYAWATRIALRSLAHPNHADLTPKP